jgi:hypothetical protein
MVGYITSGTLQVRQPFTTDLNRAANSLRIPIASTVGITLQSICGSDRAMKKFDFQLAGTKGRALDL